VHRLLEQYPATLLLTWLVEIPWWTVALSALRIATTRRALLVGVLTSLVTHPVLTYAAPARPPWAWITAAELVVVLAEAVVAWLLVRRDAGLVAVVSLGANACSYGFGLLLWWALA
jgi:hypothetical protein